MIQQNIVFRLSCPLDGIRLAESNSEAGTADQLPSGALIAVIGPSQFFGMVEVQTENGFFAVFEEDIHS